MTLTIQRRSELTNRIRGWQIGDGPPMLLIHGVGLRGEAWLPMIPKLKEHFALTVIDLPGHGESQSFQNKPTLEDYTKEIAAVLEAIGRPAIVVGHSMGALISMDLANRFPALVSGMAPLNAIYRRTKDAKIAVQNRAAEINAGAIIDPTQTLDRWFGDAPTGEYLECRKACEAWLKTVDRKSYAQAYTVFAQEDGPTVSQLSAIACPSIFITGQKEPNSTPEMSQRLSQLVPNACARVVPNARHMMPMTHPLEVCEILLDFFVASGEGHDI